MMDHCIACGHSLGERPLMTLDNMPASAQNIPDASQVAEDEGITLSLFQCPACGLVQFNCQPVDYYRDVIRAGGFTTTMVELRRRQYRHLIEAYGLEGKKFIEAGCGRGEFLSVLAEFPVEAHGIEHRADLVELAVKSGLDVTQGFPETEDTRFPGGPYDAFLSFNFLEHQPRPGVMLRCIANNLKEGGMGLITVPSLEYILQYDGYYELIRDHIAYYTFGTLRALLEENGFEVLEEEMVNRDTLSVIVRKCPQDAAGRPQSSAVPASSQSGTAGGATAGQLQPSGHVSPAAVSRRRPADAATRPSASQSAAPVDVSGLMASRHSIDREVNSLVDRLHEKGKKLAIWGASHQGFTLAATTRLGDKVSYIIDSAPFKQGRFAPTSHLPIVAPDDFHQEPVDAILIVAPGYTEEIASMIREKFGETVEILALKSNRLETL